MINTDDGRPGIGFGMTSQGDGLVMYSPEFTMLGEFLIRPGEDSPRLVIRSPEGETLWEAPTHAAEADEDGD